MNSIDNFQKTLVFSIFFVAKSKNIVVFAFTFVLDSFGLFYDDFCMDLYSVDCDEAMKRGDEAFNASSLQFLSVVKRFIATIFFLRIKRFIVDNFYGKISFTASSPLLFKRNSSLNASSPLLFKVTLPTSARQSIMPLCLHTYHRHNAKKSPITHTDIRKHDTGAHQIADTLRFPSSYHNRYTVILPELRMCTEIQVNVNLNECIFYTIFMCTRLRDKKSVIVKSML
jgi:hypothetical protein